MVILKEKIVYFGELIMGRKVLSRFPDKGKDPVKIVVSRSQNDQFLRRKQRHFRNPVGNEEIFGNEKIRIQAADFLFLKSVT